VFKHHALNLVTPDFDSSLTDVILDLEKLRKSYITGSTPVMIFLQLKRIFHLMESLGSARIEGNHTTVIELIERQIDGHSFENENIREIENIEKALDFIDESIDENPINHDFILHLHKLVVNGLSKEGDPHPGAYRTQNVAITQSNHTPPDFLRVKDYMDELIQFINRSDGAKYELLRMAIAHHRFTWIHPFTNGNGRTIRLLSYAMLLKQRFDVRKGGRILNPTAVFCNDRDKYNTFLAKADSGEKQDILYWCEYVLGGLRDEIKKIDNLLNYDFLKANILLPAIDKALERKIITHEENTILKIAVEKKEFQAKDISQKFKDQYPAQTSKRIKALLDKKMVASVEHHKYIYQVQFINNHLLRLIIEKLNKNGFIPDI
jgi:Fic family protein